MTDKPPFDPKDPIPKEYYEAVGRISNAWASFEFYIDKLIWHVAGVSAMVGTCLTAQFIGPAPRFRALAALLHFRGATKEIISSVNKFSEDVRGIAADRNRWSHDPMFYGEGGVIIRHQRTADRKLILDAIEADLAEMSDLNRKIWGSISAFKVLKDTVISSMPPLPRIPPEPAD